MTVDRITLARRALIVARRVGELMELLTWSMPGCVQPQYVVDAEHDRGAAGSVNDARTKEELVRTEHANEDEDNQHEDPTVSA